MTPNVRVPLAGLVLVLAVLAAVTAVVFIGHQAPRVLIDRAPYAAGWTFAVDHQTNRPDPVTGGRPTDDATAAWCRLWADGPGHRYVTDRTVFVAGCDDATLRTALEAP